MSEVRVGSSEVRVSATDELRRLLDERGVKWSPSAWDRSTETYWKTADGNGCLAIQGETKLRLSFADYFTPEQAIAATLGQGTCHETIIDHYWRGCCSCGYIWEFMYGIGKCERPRYCPNCGARVTEN